MLIAHATRGSKKLLILGLSRVNVAKLLDDKPMLLRRETHGEGIPEGWEIVVLYGDTEEAIGKMIEPMMDEHTEIVRDPKLRGK